MTAKEERAKEATQDAAEPLNTPGGTKRLWRGVLIDAVLVLLLLLAGIAVGMAYVRNWGGEPSYYQNTLGPAVMLACGKGYVNPRLASCPPLEDFLNLRTESFSPSDLPDDLPASERTVFQDRHRYLYTLIAVAWMFFGISWAAVHPVFGLLYGATVAASFTVFRLGMNRVLAFVFAVLILVSPLHMALLPALRDYAKAPFILASFFLLGLMVKAPFRSSTLELRTRSSRALCALSALMGAVIGVGLGFRQDIMICVPAFVVVCLGFLPGKRFSRIPVKLLAVVCFTFVMVAVGFPVLSSNTEGSNGASYFLLGLSPPYDGMLGVSPAPYTVTEFHIDEYAASQINAYAQMKDGNTELLRFYTDAYDDYGARLSLSVVRHFPADMVIRVYAAVLRILDDIPFNNLGPFHNEQLTSPDGVTNPLLLKLYAWRLAVLSLFQGWGKYFAAATLILIATRSIRLALVGSLFLLYFTGITALQFSLRHLFHLEFVGLWALGFLLQLAVTKVPPALKPEGRKRLWALLSRPRRWWTPPVKQAAGCVLIAGMALGLLLSVTRWYQDRHLEALFQDYAAAEKIPMEFQRGEDQRGRVLLIPPEGAFLDAKAGPDAAAGAGPKQRKITEQPSRAPVTRAPATRAPATRAPATRAPATRADYLVLEFERRNHDSVELGVWYGAELASNDLSCLIDVQLAGGEDEEKHPIQRLFLPIYETSSDFWFKRRLFQGFVLKREQADALLGIYRVKDPGKLPFLMRLLLTHDLNEGQRYQTLTR